jgi:REP element-mobilizing transposase RayT
MNQRRILIPPGHGSAFYHCVSRVVDRRIVFHAAEKEVFRSILRKLETFCGVRVATYCLMGNHFHLLVEVPDKEAMPKLDAETLLEMLPLLYDEVAVAQVAGEIEAARRSGNTGWERSILERYERRRGDLSVFLKELKQRVSIFFNRRNGRVGTLWESRFRSVLVEGGEEALAAVAAYIDLNPVRAGLADRPEDYRWSGYGEACGTGKGAKRARAGLASIQREGLEHPGGLGAAGRPEWREVQGRYRRLLYAEGREVKAEEAERVADGGEVAMPLAEALRRKVRYFTDGAVIGSAAFVDEVFGRLKAQGRTGPKRRTGARKMRGADFGGLRSLRDLRVRAMGGAPE